MIDYLKNLDKEALIKKAKPLGIAAVCFAAVFAAGFGVGKSSGTSLSASKRSLNYTTSNSAAQNQSNKTQPQTQNTAAAKTITVDPNSCYIKGSKSKTYHVPGGAFYERTTPAACFNTEDEAQAAGYKKSAR